MPDRKKVIEQLEHCINMRAKVSRELAKDSLALLKEREAVRPDYEPTMLSWSCGNCGQPFDRCKYKYCPNCGRSVNWE